MASEQINKFNPNHGKDGRFSTGKESAFFSLSNPAAVARAKDAHQRATAAMSKLTQAMQAANPSPAPGKGTAKGGTDKQVTNAPPSKPATTDRPATGKSAHVAAPIGQITAREKEAMGNYAGAMFKDLNARLRSGKPPARADASDLKAMDAVMSRAKTTKPMTVHRGVTGDWIDKLTPGATYTDGGFVSTTSDPGVVGVFSFGSKKATLEIHVPAGSKAVSMVDQTKYGHKEQEILLNRGSKFKVIGRKPGKNGKPDSIQVELVND